MSKGLRFKRVRNWLAFWFLLVALAPLVVVTIIIYFQRVEAIREEGIAKLTAIRDLKVSKLDRWLDEMAADIKVDGIKPCILAQFAKGAGFFIIVYKTWVHVDIRRK